MKFLEKVNCYLLFWVTPISQYYMHQNTTSDFQEMTFSRVLPTAGAGNLKKNEKSNTDIKNKQVSISKQNPLF